MKAASSLPSHAAAAPSMETIQHEILSLLSGPRYCGTTSSLRHDTIHRVYDVSESCGAAVWSLRKKHKNGEKKKKADEEEKHKEEVDVAAQSLSLEGVFGQRTSDSCIHTEVQANPMLKRFDPAVGSASADHGTMDPLLSDLCSRGSSAVCAWGGEQTHKETEGTHRRAPRHPPRRSSRGSECNLMYWEKRTALLTRALAGEAQRHTRVHDALLSKAAVAESVRAEQDALRALRAQGTLETRQVQAEARVARQEAAVARRGLRHVAVLSRLQDAERARRARADALETTKRRADEDRANLVAWEKRQREKEEADRRRRVTALKQRACVQAEKAHQRRAETIEETAKEERAFVLMQESKQLCTRLQQLRRAMRRGHVLGRMLLPGEGVWSTGGENALVVGNPALPSPTLPIHTTSEEATSSQGGVVDENG